MFFSRAHRTFSRKDHKLGHKTSLKNFKKIEIISSNFSGYDVIKLESNKKEKIGNITNMWKLNNTFLNSNGSQKKPKGKS